MSNRGIKHNRETIKQTKEIEGEERPAVFVQIFTPNGGSCNFLCYTWGVIDGVQFFDTIEGSHLELHGEMPYFIHCPLPGWTFDSDGTLREIQREKSLIAVQ